MTKWLRALTAPEDLGLIPSTQQRLTTICNSSSLESKALYWLSWAPVIYVCTDMHASKLL